MKKSTRSAQKAENKVDKAALDQRVLHIRINGVIYEELNSVAGSLMLKPHQFLYLIIANALNAAKRGALKDMLTLPVDSQYAHEERA